MGKINYSWILPIKNEAKSLNQLINEIYLVMKGKKFEIIAVNDASKDNSFKTLKNLSLKYPSLKIINFKTHKGKWAALLEGFKKSRGEIIITSDSDLQDDPKEIEKLLNKLKSGYDLVSGWRKVRIDPLYKVAISKIGNLLASLLSRHEFKDLNSPLKVYKREVFKNLPTQGSFLRFSMLFADRLGYKVAEVSVVHRPRIYGKSKFGIVKYVRILYDLILTLVIYHSFGKDK